MLITRPTIALYKDRKANWVQEEIVERAKELDSIASRYSTSPQHSISISSSDLIILVIRTLQNLHLPSSLDAMEKPIGLPPSLLRKADEVRVEGGPERIRALLQDVEGLAAQDRRLLDEVCHFTDGSSAEAFFFLYCLRPALPSPPFPFCLVPFRFVSSPLPSLFSR